MTAMITMGDSLSVLFDDVFLKPDLNDKNPFEFEDRAAFVDENQDIWVGVKLED